jgi:hypothetical protein
MCEDCAQARARSVGGKGSARQARGIQGIDPGRLRAVREQVEVKPLEPFPKERRRRRARLVIHISLPAGTPMWLVGVSLCGVLLMGVVYGLVRLIRVALPETPAERLDWWKSFWKYRRDLRHDRWKRHEQRRARRHLSRSNHQLIPNPGRDDRHSPHSPESNSSLRNRTPRRRCQQGNQDQAKTIPTSQG